MMYRCACQVYVCANIVQCGRGSNLANTCHRKKQNKNTFLTTDWILEDFEDVPGGFPKSDLLGVTVALIHVAGQRFLAV